MCSPDVFTRGLGPRPLICHQRLASLMERAFDPSPAVFVAERLVTESRVRYKEGLRGERFLTIPPTPAKGIWTDREGLLEPPCSGTQLHLVQSQKFHIKREFLRLDKMQWMHAGMDAGSTK